ncbi:hypothetical protein AGMMS50218_05220 [Actinomycetota bacterium]|nr:hypothetical protein AGMMS50218_05220 [Actinomycetota bacterium]
MSTPTATRPAPVTRPARPARPTGSAQPAGDLTAWRTFAAVQLRLASQLSRELARATGLSDADHLVLDALLDAPAGRMRALDLRLAMQWEKSRLSHQLARMAGRGLVGREDCVEDARGADVVLTADGRAAAVHAREVWDTSVRRLVLDGLGAERVAALADLAAVLDERLDHAAQDDPACRAAVAERLDQS